MGARMVAVCRGAAKADALRALGADAVVDTAAAGKDVPLRQLIKARAAPGPVPAAQGPCGLRLHRVASCALCAGKSAWLLAVLSPA